MERRDAPGSSPPPGRRAASSGACPPSTSSCARTATPRSGRCRRRRGREADDELRIGHFGDLYAPRVDVTGFLRRLAQSDRWRRVVLHLYGRDHGRGLRELSEVVDGGASRPRPLARGGPARRGGARPRARRRQQGRTAAPQQGHRVPHAPGPAPRADTGASPATRSPTTWTGRPGWLTLAVDDSRSGDARSPSTSSRAWTPPRSWRRRSRSRWTQRRRELASPRSALGRGPTMPRAMSTTLAIESAHVIRSLSRVRDEKPRIRRSTVSRSLTRGIPSSSDRTSACEPVGDDRGRGGEQPGPRRRPTAATSAHARAAARRRRAACAGACRSARGRG